jgi:putative Flp pilus-assembly TadE/G-like protein
VARSAVDERGQAVPLALVVVAIAVIVMLAIAELGGNVVDGGRARTAADAAALAGVEGGREASERVAAGNGASVVAWTSRPDGDGVTVTVTVQVGRARATAAASNRGP